MRSEQPDEDEPCSKTGQREARAGPVLGDIVERKERRHRGEGDCRKREDEAGPPDQPEDTVKGRPVAAGRGRGGQAQRDGSGEQRRCDRQERDAGKSASLLQGEAKRRAEPDRRIHRDALPRHHLAGARRADPRDAPTHRPGNEQALAKTQRQPADQQQAKLAFRAERRPDRGEIEYARRRRQGQPEQNGAACALPIAKRAGAMAGEHGRQRLNADNPADDGRAEAETVMHVKRQRRQWRAD